MHHKVHVIWSVSGSHINFVCRKLLGHILPDAPIHYTFVYGPPDYLFMIFTYIQICICTILNIILETYISYARHHMLSNLKAALNREELIKARVRYIRFYSLPGSTMITVDVRKTQRAFYIF